MQNKGNQHSFLIRKSKKCSSTRQERDAVNKANESPFRFSTNSTERCLLISLKNILVPKYSSILLCSDFLLVISAQMEHKREPCICCASFGSISSCTWHVCGCFFASLLPKFADKLWNKLKQDWETMIWLEGHAALVDEFAPLRS